MQRPTPDAKRERDGGERVIWYRIDKGDGSMAVAAGIRVKRAAEEFFARPQHAIASGRFATSWAIYSTDTQLTAEERETIRKA